jgi:formylglycine-generating enzyme required for sulfatase activity
MPLRSRPSLSAAIVGVAVAAWSLRGSAGAEDKPKLPHAPRFPFAGEQARQYRDDYAKAAGLQKDVTNSVGMRLVLIPPGSFEMGPNGSRYRVALSKPFHAGGTEVTLGQYRKFKPGHKVDGADDEFNGDDRPAAMVSWDDARAFCAWLSSRGEERKAGRAYALTTEARWEWAARAGTATSLYFGETDKEQAKFSWLNVTYTPNPKSESKGRGR